jgi:hypothetical protein
VIKDMKNIEIINEVIEHKYLFHDQKFIIEKDFDEKGKPFEMKFEIIKSNGIEYRLYKFESKDFPFFKEVPGLKKMCDFIIFADEREFLQIFLIELKLGPSSAKKQLEAANEFANFLIKSCKRIGKEINNYSIKKIRISQHSVSRRSKFAMANNYDFDEDKYLDYKLKSFHLSHLMQN